MFDADTKFVHKQYDADHGKVEYIFSNQTKQMIHQKSGMDPRTIELSFLKSEVDFELLWRCISKIWDGQ